MYFTISFSVYFFSFLRGTKDSPTPKHSCYLRWKPKHHLSRDRKTHTLRHVETQWHDYFKRSRAAPSKCEPRDGRKLLMRGEKLDRRANAGDCLKSVINNYKRIIEFRYSTAGGGVFLMKENKEKGMIWFERDVYFSTLFMYTLFWNLHLTNIGKVKLKKKIIKL